MFKWLKEYRKYRDAKFVWERMKELCDWQHLGGCANSDNPTTIRCAGEGLKGKVGRCEMLHCPMLKIEGNTEVKEHEGNGVQKVYP